MNSLVVQNKAQTTVTPCVRRCCLDQQDVCVGCFRTLEEITGWRAMSEAQREAIMQRVRPLQREKGWV